MVALDRASAIAHQKGLIKMLLLTPKPVRDGIGPLLGVIKLYGSKPFDVISRPNFNTG